MVLFTKAEERSSEKNISYSLGITEEDEFTKNRCPYSFLINCDTTDGMKVSYNLPKEVLARVGAQGALVSLNRQ